MASLFEMAVLLLCTAVSGLHVLQPLLDYLLQISPSNSVASAAAGAATLLLASAYFAGVIFVYLKILPAPPALVPSPVALRLFAAMACALLVLLLAIMPFSVNTLVKMSKQE